MKQHWQIRILCLLAAILLIIHHHFAQPAFFDYHLARRFIINPVNELYRYLYFFGATFIVLGVFPLAIALILWNERPSTWGVTLGKDKWRYLFASLILVLLLVPALALASNIPSIAAIHPLSKLALKYLKALLYYEAFLLLYVAGWEFFFRGFILFGLKRTTGDAAIYLQAIPYAIMHLDRSGIEALASIPIAVLLGHLAARTGSVLYGIIVHWLCAITLDIFVIYNVF